MASAAVAQSVIPAQVVDLSVKAPKRTPNLGINFHSRCEYNREQQAWEFIEPQSFLKFDLQLPFCQDIRPHDQRVQLGAFHVPDNPYTISVNDYTLVRHFDDHVCDFHDVRYLIPWQWLHQGHNTILIQVDQYARSRLMLKTIEVAGLTAKEVVPDRIRRKSSKQS
jgi:hypothetical protein